MSASLRKFALTTHVTSSVGWLGAVIGFLALAIVGLVSPDVARMRAAYVAMELLGWLVIVPLCFASLISGLVQSLGTAWGLFRHYWVVAKLLITVFATILLLAHMRAATSLAGAAGQESFTGSDLRGLRVRLIVDAAAALVALVVATALSVYKPAGLTPYGRNQYDPLAARQTLPEARNDVAVPGRTSAATRRWAYVFGIIVVVLAHVFLIQHLRGSAHDNNSAPPSTLHVHP